MQRNTILVVTGPGTIEALGQGVTSSGEGNDGR